MKGHRIGGAQISPMHANFIENAGDARSEDAVALMTEARRRAFEQFGVELEHEVQFLEPARAAARRGRRRRRRGEVRVVSRPPRQSPAREAVARLPSRARVASSSCRPAARSRSALAAAIVAVLAFAAARETSVFAVRTIEVRGVDPKLARHVDAALAPLEGVSLLKIRSDQVERLATSLPSVADVTLRPRLSEHVARRRRAEEPAAVVRHGAHAWLVSRRGRLMERIAQRTHRRLPRIWLAQPLGVPVGATLAPGAGGGGGRRSSTRCAARRSRGRSARFARSDGQWTYVLRGGVQIRVGDRSRPRAQARGRTPRSCARTPIFGYLDVSVPQRPVAHENSQVSG